MSGEGASNSSGMARCSRRSLLAGAIGWPLSGGARVKAPDLTGRCMVLQVSCLAPCRASQIAAAMAPSFSEFAKSERGYEAHLSFAAEAALPEKRWPADRHMVIAPTPLLAAMAAPKWIAPLNTLIGLRPALDVDWFSPVVRESFQLFPESSGNRWAIPQSGDAFVLFVRRDLLQSESEQASFREATGGKLPTSFEAFEALDWDGFGRLLGFFNRPDRGLAGWIAPGPGDADGFAASCLSYMLAGGGRLWEPGAGLAEGVLDTAGNAAALATYLGLLAYQPGGAQAWSAAQAIERFAAGGAFAALQWASAGPSMIPAAMADKVMVVPTPAVAGKDGALQRRSVVGGRFWAVNEASDPEHQRAAADVLDWWCRPATVAEFVRRGGLPCDKATLSAPSFAEGAPWRRAYAVMLEHGADLWRDPGYGDLLQVQHEMLTAALAGQDLMTALTRAACRQQAILYDEGSSSQRAAPGCGQP